MDWVLVQRLLNGFFVLTGMLAGIVVVTQNTGLSQTVMVWLGIWVTFCSGALSALPSLFGVSGLQRKREETVVREQETAGFLRGIKAQRESGRRT